MRATTRIDSAAELMTTAQPSSATPRRSWAASTAGAMRIAVVSATSHVAGRLQAEIQVFFAHLDEAKAGKSLFDPASLLAMLKLLGVFTVGRWRETEWGPVLTDGVGWLGATVATAERDGDHDRAGWALLVRGTVQHTELAEPDERGVLCSFRGRYLALGAGPADGPASLRA